jgi:hypothetical protein
MTLNTNHTPNYTLGRGKVYFARFTSGQVPGPFRYIGNTPEFNLTIESETLDHFSADEGIREKDDSVPLEVTRTGSLVCDDINAENVALFFFGSTETLTQVAAPGQSENFDGANQEDVFQLGLTLNNRVGTRGVSGVTVTSNPAGSTYVEGTDYTVDADRGMLAIMRGGGIADGSDITVNFDIDAASSVRVLSGSEPVEGALRFIEDNPKGDDRDIFLPYVKITPNGDLALKGDEWRQIPFSIEALKPSSGEAIYVDGQPVRS